LKETFQFLGYDGINLHTCFISIQINLLNTMLFLEFQIPHKTAKVIKLNCKNLLLHSHLPTTSTNLYQSYN
jgi:hypothetical protein